MIFKMKLWKYCFLFLVFTYTLVIAQNSYQPHITAIDRQIEKNLIEVPQNFDCTQRTY